MKKWRVARRAAGLGASGGLFEGAFDESEAALGLFAKQFRIFAALGLQSLQFVGDGKSSENGDFLRVDGAGGGGDGVHFFVHELGELVDIGGLQFPLDGIGLAEDLDFDGCGHSASLLNIP